MQEVTNFARFYSIFKRVPKIGDNEYLKKEMVSVATGGRTESLKEITRKEYDDLCNLLEKRFPEKRKHLCGLCGAAKKEAKFLPEALAEDRS